MRNRHAAPHHRNAMHHRGGGLRYCQSQLETYKGLNETLTTENIQLTAEIAQLLAVEPEPESQKELEAFWDYNWVQMCIGIERSLYGGAVAGDDGKITPTPNQLSLAMECINLSAHQSVAHVVQCRNVCEYGVLLDLNDADSVFYYESDPTNYERVMKRLTADGSAAEEIDLDSEILAMTVTFDVNAPGPRDAPVYNPRGPFENWEALCKMIEVAPVSYSSRYRKQSKDLLAKCSGTETISTPKQCLPQDPCAPKPERSVECVGAWNSSKIPEPQLAFVNSMFESKSLILNKCDSVEFDQTDGSGKGTFNFQIVRSKSSDQNELELLMSQSDDCSDLLSHMGLTCPELQNDE